jgi:hypothetical protein
MLEAEMVDSRQDLRQASFVGTDEHKPCIGEVNQDLPRSLDECHGSFPWMQASREDDQIVVSVRSGALSNLHAVRKPLGALEGLSHHRCDIIAFLVGQAQDSVRSTEQSPEQHDIEDPGHETRRSIDHSVTLQDQWLACCDRHERCWRGNQIACQVNVNEVCAANSPRQLPEQGRAAEATETQPRQQLSAGAKQRSNPRNLGRQCVAVTAAGSG